MLGVRVAERALRMLAEDELAGRRGVEAHILSFYLHDHAVPRNKGLGIDQARLRAAEGAIAPRHRLGYHDYDLVRIDARSLGGVVNDLLHEVAWHVPSD